MSIDAAETLGKLQALLALIAPELRCIRDCQWTEGRVAMIRPDDDAIRAADEIMSLLGIST